MSTSTKPSVAGARLTEALARMPADHFVIWIGSDYAARPGSIICQVGRLLDEEWTPVPLRVLSARGAEATAGKLDPDRVRSAIRAHQGAAGASYLLTRRTLEGDYVAVADVTYPGERLRALKAGDTVLSRRFERSAWCEEDRPLQGRLIRRRQAGVERAGSSGRD